MLSTLTPGSAQDYVFSSFCDPAEGLTLLADAPEPSVLVALRGANCTVWFEHAAAVEPAMRALVQLLGPEGDAQLRQAVMGDWASAGHGPSLFLNTCAPLVYDSLLAAGCRPHPDNGPLHQARLFAVGGPPRFARRISHSVRLGRGLELAPLLKQGIGYDEEGYYVRMLLARRPSFVVEQAGRAVSWSTVHLNNSMGMIYTPPEHRRQGYAASLTAFQIDHMLRATLRREGGPLACAHVVEGNTASEQLLASFGAEPSGHPVCWRSVLLP